MHRRDLNIDLTRVKKEPVTEILMKMVLSTEVPSYTHLAKDLLLYLSGHGNSLLLIPDGVGDPLLDLGEGGEEGEAGEEVEQLFPRHHAVAAARRRHVRRPPPPSCSL